MGTGDTLSTRIDVRDGVTSIIVSGELDLATLPALNDQLATLEHDGCEVIVVDLQEVTFIDSSALQAFVQAYERSQLKGHRFLLVGASPIARRLLQMTRTEFLLGASGATMWLGRLTATGT